MTSPDYRTLVAAMKDLAVDSGVVSFPVAVRGNDLRDTTKNWAANVHRNRLVKIVSGSGVGQLAVIDGNSSNTLQIRGTWPQAIGAGAAYVILNADFMQMLRDVLNAGYDVSVAHPLETHDPKVERQLFSMDFWSASLEEVQLGDGAAGATVTLPDIVLADLPTNVTIVRVVMMFKFRMIENTNAVANKLNGATDPDTSQVIQIQKAGGAYIDAINFVDDQFGVAAETREGGDVIVGTIDVSAQVDANQTHNARWLLARADLDFLNFNDVQVGLRIRYSV